MVHVTHADDARRIERLEGALSRLVLEANAALKILLEKSTADNHDAGEMAIVARLEKAIESAQQLVS